MDMKSAFKFSLVSFCPNVTVSYFHSSINERRVCSPKLSCQVCRVGLVLYIRIYCY